MHKQGPVNKGFGERFGSLLKKHRVKKKALADDIGVSPGAITGYISGTVPKAPNLLKIAEWFNKSPWWLLTGKEGPSSRRFIVDRDRIGFNVGPVITEEPLEEGEDIPFLDNGGAVAIDSDIGKRLDHKPIRSVPVVGLVPGGKPLQVYAVAPEEYVSVVELRDEKAFALVVKGDSMEPEVRDGEIVVISPSTDVKSGDIALIYVDGEYTLKKFIESNRRVILQPLNPRYEAKIYDRETDVQVHGRMMQKVTRY